MFKPKVKKSGRFLNFFLKPYYIGICLAPFGIYIVEQFIDDKKIINHESIHWKQQIEMFIAGAGIALLTTIILFLFGVYSLWLLTLLIFPFIFFYLWYGIEFAIKSVVGKGRAYKRLSFEREAYANDDNFDYLEDRKLFDWFKYLSKE